MLSKDENMKQSSQECFISIFFTKETDSKKLKKKNYNKIKKNTLMKNSYKTFINNNKMPDTVMKGELWNDTK